MTDSSACILQDLYDSEINFTIITFWDAGFEIKLGDELNGFAATGRVNNFSEAVEWLRIRTLEQYPESGFAKAHRRSP
ncbi:hypothetical protein [Bradyrhizobium amphicarpaeae]|uniref:Uncharacterized protein n=1 Tax=Bradyrhizobium amphicarpaeae TaxID=1404768 RepID=A0A2U8PXN1_9BRAD|nr:hypothetical protein [Bradyrhizobium amphicarpaeae]AWM02580.1 hypothetical protein CIT40_22800 [Bradyrhizobium amphicarpaeae]